MFIKLLATFIVWFLAAKGFAQPVISFESAVQNDGSISETWKQAIKDRHSSSAIALLLQSKQPLTKTQRAWLSRIKEQVPKWRIRINQLNAPFLGIKPPTNITLLFGNQGGDDGFTFGKNTICLDLRSWVKNYGDPSTQESTDRIQRILSHEYVHLLTKAWAETHPPRLDTPFDRAMWELFYEGLGNFYSLSEKWHSKEGRLSEMASSNLKKNVPILIDRLVRLSRAKSEEELELRKGLSSGPFQDKWGALPVAIWLSLNQSTDSKAVQRFIGSGPEDVLGFIRRHISEEQRQTIANIRNTE